jgi:uncharacterized protein DUF3168
MSDASLALQQAVYDALAQSIPLQNLIGSPPRLYDHHRQEPIFPYVVIGEVRVSDYPGLAGGLEHDLRVHAFSLYGGQREAKEFHGLIREGLHDRALTLTGHRLINLRFVFGDILRLRDGETWQAVLRFRAVTQPLV